MVKRKSRFVQMNLLLKYDVETVRKTIEGRFKRLDPRFVKSITFDQGNENVVPSGHKKLAENTKTKVYG
jgi:IS30 family transposase